MKLSKPRRVLDLDDFLPSDGESRFEMSYSDGLLNIDVFYESDETDGVEIKKNICFSEAQYFFKTPFPGYSFFYCPDDKDISLLSSLVEYEDSDMLVMEFKSSDTINCRHYRLFLHSVGVAIHVIAKSCEV